MIYRQSIAIRMLETLARRGACIACSVKVGFYHLKISLDTVKKKAWDNQYFWKDRMNNRGALGMNTGKRKGSSAVGSRTVSGKMNAINARPGLEKTPNGVKVLHKFG